MGSKNSFITQIYITEILGAYVPFENLITVKEGIHWNDALNLSKRSILVDLFFALDLMGKCLKQRNVFFM